jgi:hypothetical protein
MKELFCFLILNGLLASSCGGSEAHIFLRCQIPLVKDRLSYKIIDI